MLNFLYLVMAVTASAKSLQRQDDCKPPVFFLAGDSTTAVQSTGGGGWGNGFLSFLMDPAWGINYGHNGATTVSFVSGVDWDEVIESVNDVDTNTYSPYVTIQFGHNDQKEAAGISIDQYQQNLEKLAADVKAAGGTPILVTPLTRRSFSTEHSASDSLHDQRLATIAAAEASGTKYIDLNQASLAYIDAIGEDAAHAYNLISDDNTHLNDYGSVVFGRMVADLILGHPPDIDGNADWEPSDECLATWISSDETMSINIWSGLPA